MSSPARPLGHVLIQSPAPALTLQVFTDYTCPFCARMWKRLVSEVIPWMNATFPKQISLVAYTMPQPWHPQGTILAEAVLAVEAVSPTALVPFISRIYETRSDKWTDEKTVDKTRNQLYDECAALAADVGVDAAAVRDQLTIKPDLKSGNLVRGLFKQYVKFARKNGMHVSPTVVVNGLEEGSISSGWTLEQWKEYVNGKLATRDEKK
mmetsp:Transcript_5615/g.11863  ORF Transcript_5615/g.11863 Transcript_5615/m.11863 type:complete len:208 (-) Transcript_5615:62-685(-)